MAGNKPKDLGTSVSRKAIEQYAPSLKGWTVETLHSYLAGADVWVKPALTLAVIEEIQGRMMLGGGRLLPRE